MGKDGRCVGLTTLPPSCTDCLEIWEPQPPGTLRACPGIALPLLYGDKTYLRYFSVMCWKIRYVYRYAACGVPPARVYVVDSWAIVDACVSTVIPRLTKIIRSGIAFVSRNVISP